MEIVKLKSTDGYELNLHIFEVENPKDIVQIIHGMEEHQERYETLAKALNEKGFTVVTSDMRGHGETAPILGYFKDKDGYQFLLDDQKEITKFIKNKYRVEEIILFAHSMGTIIARNLLQTESKEYKKVILSGFPNNQSAAGFACFIASTIQKFKGPEYFSKKLENMAVGSFNKKVKNPKTEFDWLSYNEENVINYINDPYCGHGFKVSAFNDLFHLVKFMGKKKRFTNINSDLPILMLRGDSDPCTGFDSGSIKSEKFLNQVGFKYTKQVKFEKMRHEILNEKDNQKVINEITSFID